MRNKIIAGLLFVGLMSSCEAQKTSNSSESEISNSVAKDVSADEFKTLISSNDGVILDVRTPEEVSEGKIAGSTNIDIYNDNFESKIKELDKTKTFYVYCRSGGRSGKAMDMMKSIGFTNVYNLDGGITSWMNKGFETK